MKRFFFWAVCLGFQTSLLLAADLSGLVDAGSDLGVAKGHIEKKDWPAAVTALEKYCIYCNIPFSYYLSLRLSQILFRPFSYHYFS